jgi:hypothetical protein
MTACMVTQQMVFVRHEDDRLMTEWVYGAGLRPDEAARPSGKQQPGRA